MMPSANWRAALLRRRTGAVAFWYGRAEARPSKPSNLPRRRAFRILRRMIRPIFAAIALSIFTSAAVLAQETPPRRTVAVTGEGEVKVAPDSAVLSFAVETAAPTAAAAGAENARKSTVLTEALKKEIGANGKVSTTRYSVDPVYEQRERGAATAPPRITGYVARNQVRAQTHAIDALGKLIDVATQAGANRIDGLDFTLEQRGPAQTDALQRAGQDAQRQAEAAAAALSLKLGKILSVSTAAVPIMMPKQYGRVGMAMAEASPQTPIDAGEITVSASLQVTYEIE
jgi:uncharacterized protein YggE